MKKNLARVSSIVSDEDVRSIVVKELVLGGFEKKDQDEIMEIMREAILTRVHTAILQALGPEGAQVLSEVPEGNDKLFAEKLSTMLPHLADTVTKAIKESIGSYRESVESKFGEYGRT